MGQINDFQVVLERILGDYKNLRTLAHEKEGNVVAFGQEKVPAGRFVEHMKGLTQAQRAEALKTPGVREQVLKELRDAG